MKKKLLIGFLVVAVGLLLFQTVARAEEDYEFYFSDQLTPGAEIKWDVKTLEITGTFKDETYFDLGDHNLTQGDTIIIKVQEDPDNLPKPDGWLEQDWFDVYVNDIMVYDNSSQFYSDTEDSEMEIENVVVPSWFIFPSRAKNSTGTYYIHEILYSELKVYETHTSTTNVNTYTPYEYHYFSQLDFWPEKDNNGVTLNWNMVVKVTMVDLVSQKEYYADATIKLIYRVNKDGIADQYKMQMKMESELPGVPLRNDLVLKQFEEEGNGTIEFNVVRQGYNPPNEGGNTFSIPFPVLAPILAIITTAIIITKRRR